MIKILASITVLFAIVVSLYFLSPKLGLDPTSLERIARIFSLVAIPVFLALSGCIIQDTISKRSVSQEYVRLAVNVLTQKPDKDNQMLRRWAVDLLDTYSPKPLEPKMRESLEMGSISFPLQVQRSGFSGLSGLPIAVSPDGNTVAYGEKNGSLRISDLNGVERFTLKKHSAPVSCLLFSFDSERLVSGSTDGTLQVLNLKTEEVVFEIRHNGPVENIIVMPDNSHVLTLAADRTIAMYNLDTGEKIWSHSPG